MNERSEKLAEKLAQAQKNAEDARRLIAYHRKMLKAYTRKAKELSQRLEKDQFSVLYKAMREGGCDIEAINAAIKNGEFSGESADDDKPAIKENETEIIDIFDEKRRSID